MGLNAEILGQCVRLLAPLMADEPTRRAYLRLAVGEDTEARRQLLARIVYSGDASIFVVNMISELDAFEVAASELPAVLALFDVIAPQPSEPDQATDLHRLRDKIAGVYQQGEQAAPSPDEEITEEMQLPDSPPTMWHVFLSYSRRDTAIMRQVRDRLTSRGINVWMDDHIQPGAPSWTKVIENALEHCLCVVVLLSPDAKESEWVEKEIRYANLQKKHFFPALARGEASEAMPLVLASAQYVDIRTNFSGGINKLIAALYGFLGPALEAAQALPASPEAAEMLAKQYRIDDPFWEVLLDYIHDRRCIPFLGPDVYRGLIKSEQDVAKDWATEKGYPYRDYQELACIAQWIGVGKYEPGYIKKKIVETWFQGVTLPDFDNPANPYTVLADLELPLYVTANYDHFMLEALRHWLHKRHPALPGPIRLSYDEEQTDQHLPNQISELRPMVYYLYGRHDAPDSVVLTEEDYLNYLINFTCGSIKFPAVFLSNLPVSTLLFIGFSVSHWNFRILSRILAPLLSNHRLTIHLAVQLAPLPGPMPQVQEENMREYLKKYFERFKVHVHLANTADFIQELHERRDKVAR